MIDTSGLATGVSAGGSNITASMDGVTSNTAALTVTVPPTLQSIDVTPTDASIDEGQTQQYTATGNYSDSGTQDLTNSVTWNSSDSLVATIDISGLATGVSAGGSNITASMNGVTSNTAMLTVQAPNGGVCVNPGGAPAGASCASDDDCCSNK